LLRAGYFQVTATVFCLGAPLLWNHVYAIWRDWNLAATFLFALNLFAWCLLAAASRGVFADKAVRLGFMLSLVEAQLVTAFGILFQLY
jgi:hypothetical protein